MEQISERFCSAVLLLTIAALSANSSANDASAQKVMDLEIASVSFGMQPESIVKKLSEDGYRITKESQRDSRGIKHWQLQKSTDSRDRYKMELSATTEAVKALNYSFISGARDGFDKDAEHARLVEHFGNDPCENARRMFRCYFPDGDRADKVQVKATMDSRMYSLEFTDKR